MAVTLRVVSEASVGLTGTLTFGSAAVTGLAATSALVVGQVVQGAGLPDGTLVQSIDSTSQVTLTANAQANGATPLTFLLEPVTLAQAKAQLRVEVADDDVLIARLIGAARRVCETHTKRAFLATTFDALWDSFPFGGGYYNRSLRQFYGAFPGAMGATFPGFLPTSTGILELPRADLISVTSITYLDPAGAAQVLASGSYAVEPGNPGRIAPTYGLIWPTTLPQVGAVAVRFVAGYGSGASSVPDNVKSAILLLLTHLYENRGDAAVELPQAVASLLSPADWGGYS